MPTFVSPGLYLRELDFSAYAARVAGSVIALVGAATKGPVNVPTLLTSPDNAVKIFGRPLSTLLNRGVFGLHAAINALNETNEVWYTRVTDGTEKVAKASTPIVLNNQVIWQVADNSGVTVLGGGIAVTLQVFKKTGTGFGSDAFNALVRRFGAKNIFDSTYATITSQSALEAAIAGSGAFAQVRIPMARVSKTFENVDQFVSRFNALMIDAPLRMEKRNIEDLVNGTTKYVVMKTQNLSDLLALNFEFLITDDAGASPAGNGYAHGIKSSAGANNEISFVAKMPGLSGNGIQVVLANVGATFSGLPAVSVSGNVITVSINAGVTTANDVIAAIGGSSAARLLVDAANDTGSTGAGFPSAGSVTLSGGGSNVPAQFSQPTSGSVNLSATKTKLLTSNSLKLSFSAKSAGEFANNGALYFGHDASGLQTLEYREGNEGGERLVGLVLQPAGTNGSAIDAIAGMSSVAAFAAADYTLLSDSSSLTAALGTIDTFPAGADRVWLEWNAYEFYSAIPAVFSGGLSGVPEDFNDLVDAVIGNPADKTGLYSFANRELYDNSLLAAPGFHQAAVIRTGISVAEKAGDMLFIADTPGGSDLVQGLTVQEVVDWHNGRGNGNSAAFNSSYATTYHSWQLISDPFNGGQHWVPPSVTVLEQIAHSDNVGEVWFAPAGFKRGIIQRALDVQVGGENNQGDRDFMYSNGNAVNPIVKFPKDGIVIFGQRTLQRNASALDRINVRRLMNYVKRVTARAARPELFEAADAITMREIAQIITPIFGDIKNRRGINKFQVKIDSQTTTKLNLDNNEIVGFIVIEPTKSAEKIILNFVLTAQGASFSEALAAAGVA